MRILPLAPIFVTLLAATPAMAETLDIKEGLWEATSTLTMDGVQIPPGLLESLPEEQRAQVERLDGRPRTDRACVTQKDIAQGFQRFDKESACVRQTMASTPRRFEANVTCSGMLAGTGVARIEAPDTTHVRGAASLQSLLGNVSMTLNARWLSASCGKP